MLATRVVGRDLEIGALKDAFEQARGGHGSVVFLVGEPGIGKSRLARMVADKAEEHDLTVLRGRAVPTATPLAYRPLAEALCSAVRTGAVSDAAELDPFRPILGWLVPEWRRDDARVEDSVMALAEAVLRFLRVVAGDRGCLVVLEDCTGPIRRRSESSSTSPTTSPASGSCASPPCGTRIVQPGYCWREPSKRGAFRGYSDSPASAGRRWPRWSARAWTPAPCRNR